jgi:two-component system, NtrC family, nitrogen regulation sensor histidine kinase NtrY
MIDFIKKNIFILFIFLLTLSLGFLTFLTFIDKSFIKLNDYNLQLLLVSNIALLFVFFIIVFKEVKNSLKNNIDVSGSKANRKYITFFSLFTLIPSILISIFSLFLLSFALDQYLDKKIISAVNNSYDIAKSYVDNVKNKIESDIVLVGIDLNKNVNSFYDNPNRFKTILMTQKLIRNIDEIHLIDSLGNLILSTEAKADFIPPSNDDMEIVFNDERPHKIINSLENRSAALLKLNEYIDTYLYVVKFLDERISNYLIDSERAINFYYTVENKQTGIKVSFILIYLVIVSLLLFLSISIAIRFSSRFFRSINNLISASSSIGMGNLDIKVPVIKTDKDMEILNNNFNLMIEKLKSQQSKLLINERHEAWEDLARKLAHEIKNPLTPIQLTIDRLKNKYAEMISLKEKDNYTEYLKLIVKQIKQIENLVNEFSDFARMPKPILKDNDLVLILKENINLLKELDKSITINFIYKPDNVFFNCDNEQLGRVFFNLIKNSIESIQEKYLDNTNFNGKIDIEIINKYDYIEFIICDNGNGFGVLKENINNFLKPYFTTKKKGTGLGLAIVNKIINDHNGLIDFISLNEGAKIKINFKK